MPIVENSSYLAPLRLRDAHVATVAPALLRRVADVRFEREQIDTPDDDFLDLDWSRVGSDTVVVISHGLEGSTRRAYVRGMARAANAEGWDALAWNYRGCGEEINRRLRFYHSGETEDLDEVIRHARSVGRYRRIALVGFSLGGNITLKYLGERGSSLPGDVSGAVAFSVPCDLTSSSLLLESPARTVYRHWFLSSLKRKIRLKARVMPGALETEGLGRIGTLREFDDRYTAPIHGFADADEYYYENSSIRFVDRIAVPTLIVSAVNDPFLPSECYPIDAARRSDHLHLEMPALGGHVGFGGGSSYWSERRAIEFLRTCGRL